MDTIICNQSILAMSLFADVEDYVLNAAFLFLNHIEDVVRQYLKDVKMKVLHMRKVSALQHNSVLSPLVINLFRLMRLPMVFLYYIYVMPFLVISKKIILYANLAIKIVCRRSPQARRIVEHIVALILIGKSILTKVFSSKLTDLIAFCIMTIYEIIVAVLWPVGPEVSEKGMSMELSVEELAELLAYEEVDPNADDTESTGPSAPQYHRSIRGMHHYIPANPFKATIRIHRSGSRTRSNTELTPHVSTGPEQPGSCLVDYLGADSPASFPPTPFSRANIMNRSLDRVTSVMFGARDRLRLEAASVSRDEYTRMMAIEAQNSGQFAVFDSRKSSPAVALSCGNHCATKVGKGSCCCCCSMVPVRPNAYVYFEMSVMVSSAKAPHLGIGLSPQNCPVNVMVGSWAKSVGLYSDGHMLTGSHWHQSTNGTKPMSAGSTVGMLVYIPAALRRPTQDNIYGYVSPACDSALMEVSGEHTEYTSLAGSTGKLHPQQSSFLGSIEQTVSDGESLNPDESFGLALSNSTSNNSSRETSPEKVLSCPAELPISENVVCKFTVNGEPVIFPAEAKKCLEEVVTSNTPLYPTVSLFSDDTRVWCRFCEADIVYRSRAEVGAPPGVRVYCLDGTLLLHEND